MQSSSGIVCSIYIVMTVFVASMIFNSCTDEDSRLNGYWKLRNIQLPDKTTVPVDTQFYAFQKKYVFSFTRLLTEDNADICYGYADFPSQDKVHILMDENHTGADFPQQSQWLAFEATFAIQTVTGSQLILEKGDTLFILQKY